MSALFIPHHHSCFPGVSDSKESACNAGDPGCIPRSGKSPGEGIGYPLQYSCLEISVDRGVWRATVHGVTKSWTLLSDSHTHTHTHTHIHTHTHHHSYLRPIASFPYLDFCSTLLPSLPASVSIISSCVTNCPQT